MTTSHNKNPPLTTPKVNTLEPTDLTTTDPQYLTTTTANIFDTVEEFEEHVLEVLKQTDPRDHLYTEVPVYWGERVWKEVSRLESSSIR